MRLKMITTTLATLAVFVALTAAPAAAGPATPGQPNPQGDSIDSYLASLPAGQAESGDALVKFNTALEATPGIVDSGYVYSVDDPVTRTVQVFWSGSAPVPSDVSSLAANFGVSLVTVSWPFSRSQIDTAEAALNAGLIRTPILGFTPALVVGFDGKTRGLRLVGSTSSSSPTSDAVLAAIAKSASALAGIPVSVDIQAVGAANGSRDSDYSPYNAGGMMESTSTNDICSTGFSYSVNGYTHTSTARHCPLNDYEPPDNNNTYGGTYSYSNLGEARLMQGHGGALMFDGAWNSSGYTKAVVGSATINVGDNVCDEGANSGAHCGVNVKSVNSSWNDGSGSEPTITAQRGSGLAVIQGDSGGPVIYPLSGGSNVYAIGMIQYGWGTQLNPDCGPVFAYTTNKCWDGVGFTSVDHILQGINNSTAKLVTG